MKRLILIASVLLAFSVTAFAQSVSVKEVIASASDPSTCIVGKLYINTTSPGKVWARIGGTCVRVDGVAAAATTPGGSDTQVQFNDGGAFGGDAGFTYDKASDTALLGRLNIAGTGGNGYLTLARQTADPALSTGVRLFTNNGGFFAVMGSLLNAGQSWSIADDQLTAARQYSLPDASGTLALVGGANTQVLFNDSGVLGGDAGLVYDKTLNKLIVDEIEFVAGTDSRFNFAAGVGPRFITEGNSALIFDTQALNGTKTVTWPDANITIPATFVVGAAGANTEVQFNNSGAFGANANFTYDGATLRLQNSKVTLDANELYNFSTGAFDGYGFSSTIGPQFSLVGIKLTHDIQALAADRTTTWPNADTKIPVAPQLITVAGMTTSRTWNVADADLNIPANAVGRVCVSEGGTGNSGTSETDLATCSLPAGTLGTNGQMVRITAWGVFANNGNNKTPRVYFGATQLGDSATTATTGGFFIQATVTRTGATTQNGFSRISYNALGGNESFNHMINTSPGETLSGTVTIKVTGQSGTASNDLIIRGWIVEVIK